MAFCRIDRHGFLGGSESDTALSDARLAEGVATEDAHMVLHGFRADTAGHLFLEVPVVVTMTAVQVALSNSFFTNLYSDRRRT